MKVYLDLCCLKRPFDDQAQPRIAVETVAVLGILDAIESGHIKAVRSAAHDLENSRNTDQRRASAVAAWLGQLNPPQTTTASVLERVELLARSGIRQMDAFHLAWAEFFQADRFVTTDDKLISQAERLQDIIHMRVVNPVSLIPELPA